MLVRIFGLLGLMLALGYFVEGLTLLVRVFRGLGHEVAGTLLYGFVVMSLDLFSALALLIAAAGLLFAQRWARKMWLATMSALTLLHFLLAGLHHLGNGVSTIFLLWTWLVILLTALSWWYFNKRDTTIVPQSDDLIASPEE